MIHPISPRNLCAVCKEDVATSYARAWTINQLRYDFGVKITSSRSCHKFCCGSCDNELLVVYGIGTAKWRAERNAPEKSR